MKKKIKPSELEAEAQRLIREGKMPTLEELSDVIAEVWERYRPLILAARKLSKTEPECDTCQQLRKLLELAANEIDNMSPAEKAELRNNIRRQFGLPESDQDFLKSCGIDPEA